MMEQVGRAARAAEKQAGEAPLKVLVFAGTTEGRLLTEWLSADGRFETCASCATEYGAAELAGLPRTRVLAARLDEAGMEELIGSGGFDAVADCTHPYANIVTENARQAAQACGCAYLRVVREGEPEGDWLRVADADEAARALAGLEGDVLLTTGTKDIARYAADADLRRRLWVRCLPTTASVDTALGAGLPPSRIVQGLGPFSLEDNVALIRQSGVKVVVAKASGKAGGFWEKVQAARECGCALVVVGRPTQERGLTLEEAQAELARRAS
jgi:precorrin-6A/cobalt-precorrin-6A reductase